MSRILDLSFSDLQSDPRVDRQIGFLLDAGHEVTAAALGAPRDERAGFVELRFPPLTRAQDARRLARTQVRRWARRWLAAYWSTPAFAAWRDQLAGGRWDAVVVNDLVGVPIALAVAGGAPVVFDAHEYAPEEQSGSPAWRLLVRPYIRQMERDVVPRVAAMTTVCDGIAERYQADTGVRPEVVHNAPHRAPLEPSPVSEPIRLVHWGMAEPQRRLEDTIDVMRGLDGRFTLDVVLVGNPGYQQKLRQHVDGDERIRFLPGVPMPELPAFGNAYDIGVYCLPPIHANQELALPNKFFEFVQARLAVAIGPSPEMARLARRHGFGIVADSFEPAALAERLAALTPADVAALKARAHEAADVLNAERSRRTVVEVVERVL